MTSSFPLLPSVKSLITEARSWINTPWCADSETKGPRGGVACHHLPRAIYIGAGWLPSDFPRISGTPNQTKHSKQSLFEPFLDSRPEFISSPAMRACSPGFSLSDVQPGDLLGLRIYHCVDHLAIALDSHWMIHVLMHKHVCYDMYTVPPWSQRLLRVWRPIWNQTHH